MRPSYGWYVVGVLNLAFISAALNVQILTLLVEPIRRDFDISDTQVSLLLGFSIAILYPLLGLPLGRLADTKSRKSILTVCVTIWSLCAAACGVTKQFLHLFLARTGVGAGLAGLWPSAFSMVSDYFTGTRRALAMSVMLTGLRVGGGVAQVIGGVIIGLSSLEGMRQVPFFGEVYPWQLLFFYVGLPGLLIALLIRWTVREPVRLDPARHQHQESTREAAPATIRDFRAYVRANRRTVLFLVAGIAFATIGAFGTRFWIPTFLIRTYGWTAQQAGITYGSISALCASLGMLVGGHWAGRWAARGVAAANVRVLLVAAVGALVFRLIYPFMPTATLALIFLAPALFFVGLPAGAIMAAIQEIFPNRMRGLGTAIYLLVINFVGLGLGPTAIALVTDYVFQDDGALRYSIALVASLSALMAFVLFYIALEPFVETRAFARTWGDVDQPAG